MFSQGVYTNHPRILWSALKLHTLMGKQGTQHIPHREETQHPGKNELEGWGSWRGWVRHKLTALMAKNQEQCTSTPGIASLSRENCARTQSSAEWTHCSKGRPRAALMNYRAQRSLYAAAQLQHTGFYFQGNTWKTYLHPAAGKQNDTCSVLKVQSHLVLSSKRLRVVNLSPAKAIIAWAVKFKINSLCICPLPSHCITVVQNLSSCITSQETTTAQRALKWDRTCRREVSYPAWARALGVEDVSIPSPSMAQKISDGTDRNK